MPVSATNSRLIYDALKACDIKIMSALPETWLVHLIRMAEEDPDMTLVRLAKEEEGIGISAGAHLAAINPLVSRDCLLWVSPVSARRPPQETIERCPYYGRKK